MPQANTSFKSNQGSQASPKIQNFLESLRNNSGNSGQESPFGNPFAEFNQQKEIEKARIAQFQNARNKEWESVYSAKDKQIEKQIEQIRDELKALAKEIVKYDQNIKQAIQGPITNPGVYHINFFEHIRQIISLLRKNVSEANSWLTVFNKRSKSQGTFWNKAKSGGSAYLFSSEHSISRSIG